MDTLFMQNEGINWIRDELTSLSKSALLGGI